MTAPDAWQREMDRADERVRKAREAARVAMGIWTLANFAAAVALFWWAIR